MKSEKQLTLRILINSTPWYEVAPRTYGGIESFCANLAKGLDALGAEVGIVSPGNLNIDGDHNIIHFQSLRQSANQNYSQPEPLIAHHNAFLDALRSTKWDCVSDHTLIGSQMASLTSTPAVLTAHRIMDEQYRALYGAISRHTPIVAISNRQAELAVDVNITTVIHHGIDTDVYRPTSHPSDDYLVFLGSMTQFKGAHIAIEASRQSGYPLIIAAKCQEPVELNYFEEFISPKLGNDVTWIGEVGGPDKINLLANASGLIFPVGWEESFGLVIIEALSCGTPVIAFNRGAVPEIITNERTGYVTQDLKSMVKAIEHIDQISRSTCRKEALERFDYRAMASSYLATFTKSIARYHSTNMLQNL
ncbi:glycosyltransferase family 4 protein [Acidithrix sp. C25]|uniref:glycosyltransferase family 4 protein n=1 Tax=Acidithrix sp. C25 TaxID=1671482 RepID=UPI001BCBAA82|nr:glycosyltransferase family 4 protein [Acidithrix sp. C25]